MSSRRSTPRIDRDRLGRARRRATEDHRPPPAASPPGTPAVPMPREDAHHRHRELLRERQLDAEDLREEQHGHAFVQRGAVLVGARAEVSTKRLTMRGGSFKFSSATRSDDGQRRVARRGRERRHIASRDRAEEQRAATCCHPAPSAMRKRHELVQRQPADDDQHVVARASAGSTARAARSTEKPRHATPIGASRIAKSMIFIATANSDRQSPIKLPPTLRRAATPPRCRRTG